MPLIFTLYNTDNLIPEDVVKIYHTLWALEEKHWDAVENTSGILYYNNNKKKKVYYVTI